MSLPPTYTISGSFNNGTYTPSQTLYPNSSIGTPTITIPGSFNNGTYTPSQTLYPN